MVCCCCVPGCTSRTGKTSGVSFHEIPADLDQRRKWLKVISRKNWTPNATSNSSRVCSKHFLPTDFKQHLKRKQLIPNAVPSVFPMYPSYMQPKIQKSRTTSHIAKRSAPQSSASKCTRIAKDPAHPSIPVEEIVILPDISTNDCNDKAVQVDVHNGLQAINQDRLWKRRYLKLMTKMQGLQERLDNTELKFKEYKEQFGNKFEKYGVILQHAANGIVPAILLQDQIINYAKKRPTWTTASSI